MEGVVGPVVGHIDHQAEIVQLVGHLLQVTSLEVGWHASKVQIGDLVLHDQSGGDFQQFLLLVRQAVALPSELVYDFYSGVIIGF